MEVKHFVKNNASFTCLNCSRYVKIHTTSSRDHCNNCLYGLHVDVYPGDRMNTCKGILSPVGMQYKNGKKRIVYKCARCHQLVYNIASEDDNEEVLLVLETGIWQ